MKDVFSLKNATYSYNGSRAVLKGLTLRFKAAERSVILGSNGSGKSTLLCMLDGLIFPQSGSIHAFDRELTEDALEDREFSREFRKRVAFVFQNPDVQLFSSTVWDEIAFGPLQLGFPALRIKSLVEELLEALRIAELRDRAPHTLSDGQKKKVAIASSLATDPDVLLLDEPTNGLDPRTQVWLIELLNDLHSKGKTIISATHDLSIAGDISDRAIVLSEDHDVAADGGFQDVVGNEDLLLRVNLIHEHAHSHGGSVHRHCHGHFGHIHESGGEMHDTHKRHAHVHAHAHDHAGAEDLRRLYAMLEHWIEHSDGHAKSYREWADRASGAGEEEIAREIYLAVGDNDAVKSHLQRARDIMSAKLALRKRV